ncbi:MAG: hypothetical protein R3E96_03585 [Planctomycetota bacterium]
MPEAALCQPGKEVALMDGQGQVFGHLEVSSCYAWDKEAMLTRCNAPSAPITRARALAGR